MTSMAGALAGWAGASLPLAAVNPATSAGQFISLVPLHKGRNFSTCTFSNQRACPRVTASAQSKAWKMIKVNFQLYIKVLLPTKEQTPQGGKPRHPALGAPTANIPDCPQRGGQDKGFFAEFYCEPPSVSS